MKNFDWNEFIKGNVAVHCDTEEKTSDFLKKCHDKGMAWRNGDSLLDYSLWDTHEENTCYLCCNYNNRISYGDLDYFEEDYKIVEWEIEDMKFNWSDFKQGKFSVKINNNNRQQFIKEIKEECKNIVNVNYLNYGSAQGCYYIYDKYIACGNINDKPIINFISNTNNNDKYELHITSDGTTTNCVYKLNGEIVNKSNAKLNPIDKFDFKEGVSLCIDRVLKDNIIKKGTKFRVLNTDKHNDGDYICLDAYIGKIGTFNSDSDLNNVHKLLMDGTFEKEYINAIDKENGKLFWHQSEVEILED